MTKNKKDNQTQRKYTGDKDVKTSLRMSVEQHKVIQKNADERELPISTYMIEASAHNFKSLTPEIMADLFNIVNAAHDTMKEYAPEKLKTIESEMNRLCSLLNS